MNRPLEVLLVEDSEDDAALLKIELQRAGYLPRCHRVETPEALSSVLDGQKWDLIISDYRLPRFDGLAALAVVKEKGLDLPFIIVSGFITEETAVAAMKAGAHDYVMKDNLARLAPAVERELREAASRRERRRSEGQLRAQHTITLILATAPSFDEAASAIVRVLLESLEMDLGVWWVVDAQAALLKPFALDLRVSSPSLDIFLEASRRRNFPPGASLAGRVWEQRRAAWITGLAQDDGYLQRDEARQAGLQSAAAFPIQSAEAFFGVLEFFSLRRLEPDATLLNMMTAISSELGQFMQRRSAEEALRRAHDELEMRVQQRTAELKTTNARLQSAIAERRRLEFELLDITEKERRRIGLDLHDDLGQQLSGLALMTKGLELKLAKRQARETSDASRIHQLVQETMTHARDLAHDLAKLDLAGDDLPAALGALAEQATKLFKISCQFERDSVIPPLDSHIASQLYKVAQEAMTNAIKHAKAKSIGISLAYSSGAIILTVHNDGLPFPSLKSPTTGMGLRIMRYRANLIGATLDIKGTGPHGTRVICSVPLEGKR